MPQPIPPSAIRNLIPGPTGNFCEKFLTALNGPRLFYEFYSYTFLESGEFTPEFIADLCATQCFGGNGGGTVPPGGLAAPTGLMASDGAFSDRVHLAWVSVVTADGYDIYRGLTNDSASATVIASVGQTTQYDDTNVTQGQTYWYWVRAKKAAVTSALSTPDSGYATGESDAITDLKASRGFYGSSGAGGAGTQVGIIALVFTPGAAPVNAYDFYRGTTDVFSAASTIKIDSDRIPFDNARSSATCAPTPCTKPEFVDGGGELVYRDRPPNAYQKYYYWVVAKHISGSNVLAVSIESNSAFGWVSGNGSLGAGRFGDDIVTRGGISTVPPGVTKAWIVLHAPAGSGAGGNGSFGGGGGGGGAIFVGLIDVVAGKHFKYVAASPASGGAGETNGNDSPIGQLQYDGSGAYLTVFESSIAAKGLWNVAGGGTGGAGGTAFVVTATGLTETDTEAGRAGKDASGTDGGRGGAAFGEFRSPANNMPRFWNPFGQTGVRHTGGGGGSDSVAGSVALSAGADGAPGYAIVKYY